MEYVYYILALLGFGLGVAAIWVFTIVVVLGIMKFNAWAARCERHIKERPFRRRSY